MSLMVINSFIEFPPAGASNNILMETGDYLLLETGDKIVLES